MYASCLIFLSHWVCAYAQLYLHSISKNYSHAAMLVENNGKFGTSIDNHKGLSWVQ